MPKVSVIIPTYNRSTLLVEAVLSVSKQSYSNLEIIISDNCSSDNTKKIVTSLQEKDSRIRYFRNHKNLGMIGNWNKAITHVRGKYCAILMDDDLWDQNFIQNTVEVLEKNKDVGFVHTWIKIAKIVNGKTIDVDREKYRYYSKSRKRASETAFQEYIREYWPVGLPSAVLFRFNKGLSFTEAGLDPGYWLDLCRIYPAYYYLDQALCIWRIQEEGTFTSRKVTHIYNQRLVYNLNKSYNYLLEHKLLNMDLENRYITKLKELL
jgi:glycosyltransferase involved in cell wall biosynthesis